MNKRQIIIPVLATTLALTACGPSATSVCGNPERIQQVGTRIQEVMDVATQGTTQIETIEEFTVQKEVFDDLNKRYQCTGKMQAVINQPFQGGKSRQTLDIEYQLVASEGQYDVYWQGAQIGMVK